MMAVNPILRSQEGQLSEFPPAAAELPVLDLRALLPRATNSTFRTAEGARPARDGHRRVLYIVTGGGVYTGAMQWTYLLRAERWSRDVHTLSRAYVGRDCTA